METADIDALYGAFCRTLPKNLQETGSELAFRLRLVPAPEIPWSQVFKHRVTLAAPELFREGMRGIDSGAVERAVFSHMLAVIEAFGSDRIADGQIEDAPDVRDVLGYASAARDEALLALGGHAAAAAAKEADLRTLSAIATERRLLKLGEPVDFRLYESVSAGKQAVGLPSTLALARIAGFTSSEIDAVRSTLMGVWLGLQFQDDVVDWEDDAARGGAWAVLLARHQTGARQPTGAPGASSERQLVFASGALAELLHLATGHFERARIGAESLGAVGLARWLGVRETEARDVHLRERRSPGYLARRVKLAPWSLEVLG